MRVSWKQVRGNLLTLFVALLLSLATVEGAVRMMAGLLGISSYMEYDDVLGWTARPDTVKRHKDVAEGFDVTYVINNRGFRGGLYSRPKGFGTYRIVVLGDSNGFGWGVDEGRTFAARLDAAAPNVEVLNLSLSGYGTDQQYLRFLRDGVSFEPDLVVVQLTTNDFQEIQHSFFNQKPKPQYILSDDGELRLMNVPVRAIGPKAAEFAANSIPLPFQDWLGWNSYAYGFLNEKYYRAKRRFAERPNVDQRTEAITSESVRLFAAIVRELKIKTHQLGARMVVFHGSREISESEIFRASGVEVVDLYPNLVNNTRDDGDPALFKDGYHFNARGHEIIARELWT